MTVPRGYSCPKLRWVRVWRCGPRMRGGAGCTVAGRRDMAPRHHARRRSARRAGSERRALQGAPTGRSFSTIAGFTATPSFCSGPPNASCATACPLPARRVGPCRAHRRAARSSAGDARSPGERALPSRLLDRRRFGGRGDLRRPPGGDVDGLPAFRLRELGLVATTGHGVSARWKPGPEQWTRQDRPDGCHGGPMSARSVARDRGHRAEPPDPGQVLPSNSGPIEAVERYLTGRDRGTFSTTRSSCRRFRQPRT